MAAWSDTEVAALYVRVAAARDRARELTTGVRRRRSVHGSIRAGEEVGAGAAVEMRRGGQAGSSGLTDREGGQHQESVIAVRENLTESYPAVPDAVTRGRHAVAEYACRVAGMTGDALDAVRTAVSEAITNAVVHAYRDGPGFVHVAASLVLGELWVLVSDDGCGYQKEPVRAGLGLGLAIIADACEDFVITERSEGGTEARMRFFALEA